MAIDRKNGAKCAACGAPLIYAVNIKTGNKIPLDARSVVYRVYETKSGIIECAREELEGEDFLAVSHFATCPKAQHFSKGGKNA